MNPLINKHILLGVTGSIACYKAADLASKLRQAGAEVDVILTGAARQFVTPLTFQSVTGQRAYVDDDLWGDEGHVLHIGLAQKADALLIAPATANTMAKLAHGQADNLLSLTALAAECPLLIAPAMDGGMFTNAATQANLEILKQRGATILGPAEGHLASGLKALGRMVEPQELVGHLRVTLAADGTLAGKHVVVTAGGTRETIDPVRFISNRSSGRQGYALAQAALDVGAEVTLITGPTNLTPPIGVQLVDVASTEDMKSAVLEVVAGADALLMAAAVADFRPAKVSEQKIKKAGKTPSIELALNPDILLEVAKQKKQSGFPKVTVGFAAESQDLLENARGKLEKKALDMIVANDISAKDAGFAVETNRVTLLHKDGTQEDLPLMSKDEVAQAVVQQVAALLEKA
ncbi:MAG: bifunctional phosphopantothenoylcysteine decarboxylase/phosphopantothenate--cysteine ligase CoaBC [Chloroflexi bacterium]|nr:MAG: bifunctional phosphopantothenoylcysteine decarboxylase/phosphopantothenate--cysteine ligase CoaBC [Chloroflexota bacterium]MBL1194333.1 bifunctional phosphopantothenoylcysteine decarboxylase/phosphopantothenate--cysteine ligase CoaBC [Chloroflexota bacterium]NOH11623.1 bifunctional phosphopantothenoylcysteine decarboxylase/phosphopantothenate--cysteine ligase CoaBC [Chloroflexota bacterium]